MCPSKIPYEFFLHFYSEKTNENEEVSEYDKSKETKVILIAPFPTLIKNTYYWTIISLAFKLS